MGKHKSKKHKKDKKHKKEKKRRYSTSSSSESSEDEWVEKDAKPVETINQTIPKPSSNLMENKEDEWGSIFSGKSTAEIRKDKQSTKEQERVSMEVKPGQSSRELNPYWKNGGTGLPPERDSASNSRSLFKRPDDDFSSNHSRDLGATQKKSSFRRPGDSDFGRHDEDVGRNRKSDIYHKKSSFKRPEESDHTRHRVDSEHSSNRFRRPDYNERDGSRKSSNSNYLSGGSSRSGGWRKPSSSSDRDNKPSDRKERTPDPPKRDATPPSPESKILTSDEINAINAKILRAELSGNTELVEKLKKQLQNTARKEDDDKTRILTRTDSRGYTVPVRRDERAEGPRKKKRVATHENQKRVRYFADDDDHSLQDMYEKEKYSSAHDQEADFMNLMGREMQRKDGSLALDDPFEETASLDYRNKRTKQQWDRAVREQAKKEKIFDDCKWCLGAKRMDQKLALKTKQKVYLSCPPFQSLTPGHCLIIPHSHISCSTQVDEDIWEEVMDIRKELVRLFEKNDEDVIFFEYASYLHKHPHMIIHCVPVPKEAGDTAPIYFKKALLECESEWSNNKKVVDLAGKGVRKAVPKGLPYFFVDFGDQAGYAHVIEDQQLFPRNFAQEIIGGMLDLSHELWRKQRNVSDEELEKNLKYLKDLIQDDD